MACPQLAVPAISRVIVLFACLSLHSVSAASDPDIVEPDSEQATGGTAVDPVSVDILALGPVRVEGRAFDLVGIARNATEGYVGQEQLKKRPLLRIGELLETIPGFVATQHSGAGKGNQMFVRGFNLDHGTDFATHIDGMPVNLPTHAHGQGYTDLNFMIPELVGHLRFRKGPYYADEGDFSAAGSAHFRSFDRLPQRMLELAAGSDDFRRGLLADSTSVGSGDLLGALELFHHDGPWTNPDDFDKVNAVARYSRDSADRRFSVALMGYHGEWSATDQIPRRAVLDGRRGRFDAIDPSDGGESHRFSLSTEWGSAGDTDGFAISAYAIDYRLALFSNFTFFLDDPVNGDQFEQFDSRNVYGGQLRRAFALQNTGIVEGFRAGLTTRFDDIHTVGLFRTRERQRLSTISLDEVEQWSTAGHLEADLQLAPRIRGVVGVRADYYRFDVASNDIRNSGERDDFQLSPSFNLAIGPWASTEFYFSAGRGFHSNDGRGTVRTIDPNSGDPTESVDPLVSAEGIEVGVRSSYFPDLETSLTLFTLALDSELVFVGDAGTTEPNRGTRRYGVEWANFWRPLSWLSVDADVAFTRARFKKDLGEGRRIPNAMERVIAAGITVDRLPGRLNRLSGAVRLRHFGSYPLTEDNSQRAGSTTLINLDAGWAFSDAVALHLGLFNLLDRKDSDIEYFDISRLPGEPAEGIEDVLFHPVLPRQVRLRLLWSF
ncbi:MAG TPA: TonB-dependent receptor [Wenzhouxiangellaceae bacterium]|nr:TonB-dependent receptor [Wenzhouxiangellaceae bacterium]